jgi:hypothetical protein
MIILPLLDLDDKMTPKSAIFPAPFVVSLIDPRLRRL